MERVTSITFLVLCVAAVSSAAANPLFPSIARRGTMGDALPPFYGANWNDLLSPSESPAGAPSYDAFPWLTSGPSSESFPWLASSLVDNPDQWPAPWTPLTTVHEAFGDDAEKVYGDVSLLDGLSSKGEDGYSRLLKEGITALLNAIDKHYKYTEDDVKKCFSFKKSLSSEDTATVQAHMFEDANTEYVQTRGA